MSITSNQIFSDNPESGLILGDNISGVKLHRLTEHIDQRGSFTEIYQSSYADFIQPAQWSLIRSTKNSLRGMHVHYRHDEYFLLVSGHVYIGLYDVRPNSPTENKFSLYELFADSLSSLTFPWGILHGWLFTEDSIHIQATSEEYSIYNTDDNFGCRWDDSELNIPWPIKPQSISERSANFPTLPELKSQMRQKFPDHSFGIF